MNEQTRKLQDRFHQILRENMDDRRAYRPDLLLKACKEAGLIFKHDCQNCPKREEDDWGLVCVLTCAEPLKEIDIGQEITE